MTSRPFSRPVARGKFLFTGQEKYLVKGTTYGAFPPNSRGDQFPEPGMVELDFELMRRAGINTILTYTVPPVSLLDQAQQFGIRVIVNIPWMEYVCFLENNRVRRSVLSEVRAGVAACRRHPAVLMFCVGKELPPAIVRWHGARKVERFLNDLCCAAKDQDPGALITYTNFPTTEYLELPFVDVFTFNVYLHQREQMCAYLSKLQHLAGEKPLVLTEFGICSFRHGEQTQAEFIDWQLEEAFDHGLAGAVVFSWTDPFYQDHTLVDEWGFGLVNAQRQPKPSYAAARRRFTAPDYFPEDRRWPSISVVVAAHNAERTLDACLRALERLNYPNYEVIVVNDGSTDQTEAIMQRYRFCNITTPNQGVSAARNEGLRAAQGEIVAYIDSDADADPDWLKHIATAYLKFDVAGVGGPNLVPEEDNWIAKCVFRSPGGPTQVMLDDQYAEHIPGCNMTFRRAALIEAGGFDPIFRAAADDVDICWRLLDRGYRIGFAPAAVVWHHRRPSIPAYWRQQVGYGVSEAILERKFPNKFNPFGHAFWAGRIYAPYPKFRLLTQPVIYQGLWGSAAFQPMYEPAGGSVLTFLPRAMEWHLGLFALLVAGAFSVWPLLAFAAGLLYTVAYCMICSMHANLDILLATEPDAGRWRRARWRATIAWLHFLEPIARDWGRLKGGLTPWRSVVPNSRASHGTARWWQRIQPFGREVRWAMPGNPNMDKYLLLDRLTQQLTRCGCAVGWNADTQSWDVKAGRGTLGEAFICMVVEHHGGPRRLARMAARIRPSKLVRMLLAVLVAAAAGAYAASALLTGVLLVFAAILWTASVVTAGRLELAIQDAAYAAIQEMQAGEMAERLDSHAVLAEESAAVAGR